MRKFGLIGKTLGHSFSEEHFSRKFANEEVTDATYDLFELATITQLLPLISSNRDLVGLNVTSPYKEEVLPYLDFFSEEARQIGAANVIRVFHRERPLLAGFNTDSPAFFQTLNRLVKPETRALILGTGGASKAVRHALSLKGIPYLLVSRDPEDGEVHYSELTEQAIEEHELIVNATPLGTFPNVDEFPNIPYDLLTPNNVLYDLVYNPSETAFLRKGREKGTRTKSGLEMLQLQAEMSWRIWNA